MEMTHTYLFLGLLFGLGMTLGVGANELANVMSTAIGSKAISPKQAFLIAIIFELTGALLGGTGVVHTVSHGLINIQQLLPQPDVLVQGMLAVMLAGTLWLIATSMLALPISITQAIIGAIAGFGLIVLGPHHVHWQKMLVIGFSWICAPILAGISSFLLFVSIQKLILGTTNPSKQARIWLPVYFFLVGIVLSVMVILKGLEHAHIELNWLEKIGVIGAASAVLTAIGKYLMSRIQVSKKKGLRTEFHTIEQMFSILMIFTACAMVFAHGSNDVAVTVGPMAAILGVIEHTHGQASPHVLLILLAGCLGVITGFLLWGRKIVISVGSGITRLTPSRAYCATFAAAIVVVTATSIGIPVSATQTLVGAVLGVGLARGIGAIDLRIVRNIFMSWIITIPMSAGLTIGFYYLFRAIL